MNEIRELVKIIESQELSEGFLDTLLAKLPGDVGASAQGRLDLDDLYQFLRKGWLRYAASINANPKDPEELADYLVDVLGMPEDEVGKLDSLKDDPVNLKNVFMQSAEMVQRIAGPSNVVKTKATTQADRGKRPTFLAPAPESSNPSDILEFFREGLEGDLDKLKQDAAKAGKNPNALAKTPLGLLGYAYLKVGGVI